MSQIKKIRSIVRFCLLLSLLIFIVGGLVDNIVLVLISWTIWGLLLFVPITLFGIERVTSQEVDFRILLFFGPRVNLMGEKARFFGKVIIAIGVVATIISIGMIVFVVQSGYLHLWFP